MIDEVKALVDEYHAWLKDETAILDYGDLVEITMPYLDRSNDYIGIYVRRDGEDWILSDGADTIDYMTMDGITLDTPKRHRILNRTLASFGMKPDGEGNELTKRASAHNFAVSLNYLILAMLAVNGLEYLGAGTVSDLYMEDLAAPEKVATAEDGAFLEEVAAWLDAASVRYTQGVSFAGASGCDHRFEFVIPKSGEQPERMIQVLNDPCRQTAKSTAFTYFDTRHCRPVDSRLYVVLNDTREPLPPFVDEFLAGPEVRQVPWSDRGEFLDELIA